MPIDHLRGPVKGVKSFDKVCSHLLYTQDFVEYTDELFKVLDSAVVSGWHFEAGGSDYDDDPMKKKNVAPPVWRLLVNWGKKSNGEANVETVHGPSNIREWMISISRVVDEAAINQIAIKNFGNPKICPTYNCKLDKLLGKETGNENGKKSRSQENLWLKAARDHLAEKLMDKISRTQDKLRQSMQEMLDSPHFEQDRVNFHERGIADEIKKVLLKFSSVAKPHVIKMAMDEFVCHEIMES